MISFVVRPAEPTEIPELAALWHQAWHDAHAQIVPTELTRLRPVDTFDNGSELRWPTPGSCPIEIRTNMVNLDEPHEMHSVRSAGKAAVALVDRFLRARRLRSNARKPHGDLASREQALSA